MFLESCIHHPQKKQKNPSQVKELAMNAKAVGTRSC